MLPYRLERLTISSPSSYLDQYLLIEKLSFPIPLGLSSLKEDLINPDVIIDGILIPDRDINRSESELVAYSNTRKFYDEMHIMQLATRPQFRKQGYGKILIAHVLEHAKDEGCQACLLEVRKSNHAAIALYYKFGFQLIGTRRKYYQDNGEDALVLRKI